MKRLHIIFVGAALLGLSACTTPSVVSRAVAPSSDLLAEEGATLSAPAYRVSAVNVSVPQSLEVSEANTYKPVADIVWREDPYGDRHAQVNQIVTDALMAGTASLQDGRDVILNIEVRRFHALTQRTRYSVGGVHDIHFLMTVVDAETGLVLQEARMIETELKAYGGMIAVAAEARGQTQKVRISAHLAQLIRAELAQPIVIPAL